MKIVFMGTPDFAVDALQSIMAAGHEVVAVVTQPDKPKGRGKSIQYNPVKACAIEHKIEVFQPSKIKMNEAVEKLKTYQADIFVVAAFGQILSKEILELPPYGCINIHGSLLPKYRGAAPIQWAVIDGETETGITIMQMDIGLDTGDMLCKVIVPISETETGESLYGKMQKAGGILIVKALEDIQTGDSVREVQDDSKASYAKMLTKSLGEIDWKKPAIEIERLVRGLNSWPSAYTFIGGKTLKIWEAKVIEEEASGNSGEITLVDKKYFIVNTGCKLLKITVVQLEGKKRMDAQSFLLGNKIEKGMMLGKF